MFGVVCAQEQCLSLTQRSWARSVSRYPDYKGRFVPLGGRFCAQLHLVSPLLQNVGTGSTALKNSNDEAEQSHVTLTEFTRGFETHDVALKAVVTNGVASTIGLKAAI